MKEFYLTLFVLPAMIAAKPIEQAIEKVQKEHEQRYRLVDSLSKVNDKRRTEAFELERAYEKSINDPQAQKEAREN